MAEQKKVPSELVISEKWDTCLERSIINLGMGLVVGGLSAVVLARSPGMRRTLTGFGGGFGVGYSWVLCSQDFERLTKSK